MSTRRSLHFTIPALLISSIAISQNKQISGVYKGIMPALSITLNPDSTFNYSTHEMHPTFYRWEEFSENGKWTMNGDTITLNPGLDKKKYVEYDSRQSRHGNSDSIWLSFYHIKRYFDANGNIRKIDTTHISQLDFAFNEFRRKKLRRVTPNGSIRCAFAGYIPKEIITSEHLIPMARPTESIKSIFIGCYELQGTKEIKMDDAVTHFVFNVYSNYYDEGQIRQVKLLVKNRNVIYTTQKANGKFIKDTVWSGTLLKVKKQKETDLAQNVKM